MGKQLKKGDFSKLANNSPKSGKRIKQMPFPPFWGDVGVKKWSPFFWAPEYWHFGSKSSKEPMFRCPKVELCSAKSKNGDHFFTPTSP